LSEAYLRQLQSLLKASPYVAEPRITLDDRGEVLFIRADIYFIDNSLLHFRELYVGRGKRQKQSYTYHYQRADGALIFRYDNSPHYPDLPTAPYHKHLADGKVVEANDPNIADILKEIEGIIAPEP
jgi:hypothetical protein